MKNRFKILIILLNKGINLLDEYTMLLKLVVKANTWIYNIMKPRHCFITIYNQTLLNEHKNLFEYETIDCALCSS